MSDNTELCKYAKLEMEKIMQAAENLIRLCEETKAGIYSDDTGFRRKFEQNMRELYDTYMQALVYNEDERLKFFESNAIIQVKQTEDFCVIRLPYLNRRDPKIRAKQIIEKLVDTTMVLEANKGIFKASGPYDIYYFCVYPNGTLPGRTTDHDNLDMKLVCDAFARSFNFDDNGYYVGIVARTVITDLIKNGYYVILTKRKEDDVCYGSNFLLNKLRKLGF